jgi:hypothetical protein
MASITCLLIIPHLLSARLRKFPLSSQQLPGVFMLAQSGSGALPYAPDGQEGP